MALRLLCKNVNASLLSRAPVVARSAALPAVFAASRRFATVTFKGKPVNTVGALPAVGTEAPDFDLTTTDLEDIGLDKFAGKRKVLNIFPSIDTGVCAKSVRRFNELASKMSNTVVLCISADLPFAHARFCGAEGIKNVHVLSVFRSSFPEDYGVVFSDGPLNGLCSRAVVVLDEKDKVIYTEQVKETTNEPDYEKVLAKLK